MSHCGDIYDNLFCGCKRMLQHALSSGISVPTRILTVLEPICPPSPQEAPPADKPDKPKLSLTQLGKAHAQLVKLVQPATPGALIYLAEQRAKKRSSWLRFLGPVPLVRGLVIVAAVSLIALLGLSLIKGVDGHLDWANECGWVLLCEELFLLASAGVGASFAALFQVSRFITRRAYDPQYTTTYWIRLVLGFISGMILAMLIPIGPSPAAPEVQAASQAIQTASSAVQLSGMAVFTKPLLAMLGGFSVTVVYRILNRLVTTVESLVTGESSVEEQMIAQRHLADAEMSETRASLVTQLSRLRRHGLTADDSDLVKELDKLIDELSGEEIAD
jgi:hypothetical protein